MQVELRGITKRFPGVVANRKVDLSLKEGEVHSLLGENGAGKTTLMNVLYGLYEPDEGTIAVNGTEVSFPDPAAAIAARIGMVHQHFMLVPVFTVTENIMLGVEDTHGMGFLDKGAARDHLRHLSEEYGLHVDPDARIENLPVGVQQRVEILKALYRETDLLILDEPTAVLTPREARELFRVIRTLKESGRTIVFISHKLKEVLEISDRITVLRTGEVVGETTPAESDERALAALMVGRDVQLEVARGPATPGDPVLEVTDLEVLDDRRQKAVDRATFAVREGEILAIAGVQGNGQTELVEAITGIRSPIRGTVRVAGRDMTGATPRHLFDAGLAHVPEDRLEHGLVESFPLKDNLVLNSYRRAPFARGFRIDREAIRALAERVVKDFDIRAPSVDVDAGTLSGGTQQKVIVAREFTKAERVLVAAQPTRGLDVGSIQYIHAQLVAKRDEGTAVLIVSSELDEVLAVGDRIAVMYHGRIVDILERSEATRERVGLMMAGGETAPEPGAAPDEDGPAAP